jgi:AraC family transcriptional regulator, arabinose operon regulatory protein
MSDIEHIKLNTGFSGERYIHIPLPLLDLMKDDPLSADLHIHSLGFFAHARYHYVIRNKGCQEYILIYCREGKGKITLNGREIKIEPNQLIVLPPNIPHRYEADHTNPWSIYWVHFMGAKAEIFSRKLYEPVFAAQTENSRIEVRLELFEEIFNTLRRGFNIDNLNFANIVFAHFLATFTHAEQFQQQKRSSEYSNNVISRVVHYMNENIENNLTIHDFASYCGYSPSYFYRKFMREMEIAPMNYFTNMKINKASILLVTTNMQVSQIAAKVGYKDSFHFSRVFSKTLGISPNQFRKEKFRL